jgi:hypothetical protein
MSADRGRRYAALLIAAVCGICFFCGPAPARDNVVLNVEGTLQAGMLHFASFAEYVRSDYFREHGKRCGTWLPEPMPDDPVARSVNDCTLSLTVIRDEYWSDIIYTLPVWFHVIYRQDGTGDIPDERIRAQMQALNEDFRALADTMGGQGVDSRIQFSLAGITRTMNDDWYNDFDWQYEADYKLALHKDPDRFVNIYTNSAGGYLGYTYYPQNGVAGAYFDGIVLHSEVVGGRHNGLLPLYDQGRTLVHEMGHYLGLLHTFEMLERKCANSYSSGDLIVDTPSESEEHYKCFQTYTCDTPDAIHNYMNYTPDACMQGFTREQSNRAVCALINYRPLLSRAAWDPGSYEPPQGPFLESIPPFLLPLLIFKGQ